MCKIKLHVSVFNMVSGGSWFLYCFHFQLSCCKISQVHQHLWPVNVLNKFGCTFLCYGRQSLTMNLSERPRTLGSHVRTVIARTHVTITCKMFPFGRWDISLSPKI